jgi:hypothetical protein
MALFLRVFISLFLFYSSNLLASNTFTYWASSGYKFCSASLSAVCNSFIKSSFLYRSDCTTTTLECAEAYDGAIKYSGTCTAPAPNNQFESMATSTRFYSKFTLQCANNEKMELTGCTAKCVPDIPPDPPPADKCAIYKGQVVNKVVSCGTAACLDGGTVKDGSILTCTTGKAEHFRSPASTTVDAGCSVNSPKNPARTLVKAADAIGKSSLAAYCLADYTYTGISSSDTPPITGLTELSLLDFTPTTEDGSCPPEKPKKGEINGLFVCYANDVPPVDPAAPLPETTNPDGSTTKTNPDGSTTTTSKKTTTNPDGSTTTTTTKETTKPDGTKSKTTETTTKNANGTTTKKTTNESTTSDGKKLTSQSSTTTSDSKTGTNNKNDSTTSKSSQGTNPDGSSFDNKANDSSSTQNDDGTSSTGGGGGSCPEGGCNATTSGKCDTPPVCSGDPLVCASINQQWISTCKQTEALTKITTEEKTASDAAITSANGQYSTAKSNANVAASGILNGFTNSVDSGSKSGTCIVDASLPVMGKSLKIPFSQACAFFKFLRMLVIFMSYLAAMRIVYKGAV